MRRANSQKQKQPSGEFRVGNVIDVSPPPPPPTVAPPAAPTTSNGKRLSSTPSLTMSPLEDIYLESPERKSPVAILPPTLRPQHVYAPVAPLGMLSLGVLSKHKDEGGGSASDIRNIIKGTGKISFKIYWVFTLQFLELVTFPLQKFGSTGKM